MTFVSACVLAGFFACDSDSDSEVYSESILSTSTQVTAFSLSSDDSVLVSLDSVYFSIDLENARIFNADSLPFGTKVNKLVPKITYSAASRAEISFPRPGMADSVVDYLNNSTDSIDFSHGPVKFLLVSGDGTAERTYTISVNVHKVKPDSLYWTDMAYTTLPTDIAEVAEQRTVRYQGKAYCLTSGGGVYCLAVSENPADKGSWQKISVDFGFTPDIESFASTTDALFILDATGRLYVSTDGLSWTSTSENWHSIIGGYGAILLGVARNGQDYTHVTYPASDAVAVKQGFPVEGTSVPVTFDVQWGNTPQLYIIGGQTADGKLVADSWGYDGRIWQKVSNTPLPEPMRDVTLFPYHSFITNTENWSVTGYQVLIALGGKRADGRVSSKTYISYNMGLVWKECSSLMQLPPTFPAICGAQALIFDSTLKARVSDSDWIPVALRKLPPYYTISDGRTLSRAARPVESWDCPYIYLFGGCDLSGKTHNTIWRGVLNRLTFKPLQ